MLSHAHWQGTLSAAKRTGSPEMASSSGGQQGFSNGLERSLSGRDQHSGEQDADLTVFFVPTSSADESSPSMPSEDHGQNTRRQIMDRYSNIGLPEVVTSRPASTVRAGIERGSEGEPSKSRESNKYFVSANSLLRGRHTGRERETPSALSSSVTTLFTVSHLVFFSVLGTLARFGVEVITTYPCAPVTSAILWPNLGGSFLLGFLNEDRRLFREEWGIFLTSEDWSFHPSAIESSDADTVQNAFRNHTKVKKTIPLFIGLTTGFCGCFTSFSSFMRDAFLALANSSPCATSQPGRSGRNGGYSFGAVLAVLTIHTTVSLCAFTFGGHLAFALDKATPTLSFRRMRTIVDPLTVFLGFGSWIIAVFLCTFSPLHVWRGRTYALVFAPLGCLLRFYVSKHLNPRVRPFPLGTFTVNIFGTMILGICFDLQHSTPTAGRMMSCQILQGMMEGFCGCLTTVSTWVSELKELKRKHGYVYGFASVLVGLSMLIVVMGSLRWSRGFLSPVCT